VKDCDDVFLLYVLDASRELFDGYVIWRSQNETSYIARNPDDIDIDKSCLTANCEQDYGSACLEKFSQNRLQSRARSRVAPRHRNIEQECDAMGMLQPQMSDNKEESK
jgi:hypothetical protein